MADMPAFCLLSLFVVTQCGWWGGRIQELTCCLSLLTIPDTRGFGNGCQSDGPIVVPVVLTVGWSDCGTCCTYSRMVRLWYLLYLQSDGPIVVPVVLTVGWSDCGTCCTYSRMVRLWYLLYLQSDGPIVVPVVLTVGWSDCGTCCTYSDTVHSPGLRPR